ncbi:hypothetical protein COU37_01775 [Candidatus Micrarchaeota archaeon CG10_big_fil_rev_8_21_14_0_10_45_29]|nr:MAG: hypothetical protein COU37_01775 [Candidatus Micrarchaeota archaeon CG10_big_fil_rev_8_21_14_0_10_45_29]
MAQYNIPAMPDPITVPATRTKIIEAIAKQVMRLQEIAISVDGAFITNGGRLQVYVGGEEYTSGMVLLSSSAQSITWKLDYNVKLDAGHSVEVWAIDPAGTSKLQAQIIAIPDRQYEA